MSKTSKLVVLIDGYMLYSMTKSMDFMVDYRRLKTYLASRPASLDEAQLLRIHYYSGTQDDAEYSSNRPLLDWLDYNGYTVITKPIKTYMDAGVERKTRINFDVQIALDAVQAANYCDTILIVANSPELAPAIAQAQRCGVRVILMASLKSGTVPDELRRQIDHFIEIDDIVASIQRDDKANQQSPAARPPAAPRPTRVA